MELEIGILIGFTIGVLGTKIWVLIAFEWVDFLDKRKNK